MYKIKKIVFQHGLGLSNKFWSKILPFFQKYNCILLEDNYFNRFCTKEVINDYKNDDIKVGIGHSLGFAKLCREFTKINYLIGINAFTNFLGNDSKLHASRSLEYEMFKQSFHNNPKSTLKRFYRHCGIELSNTDLSYINITKIKDDLNFLIQQVRLADDKSILIINSIDDQVVPKRLAEDNFADTNVRIHYLQNGKHGLGFFHPETVSKIILDFIS